MSNSVDVRLDVLASSPEEINKIEAALQDPCEELLAWVAKKWEANPKEIAADLKPLVAFKPIRNLGYTAPQANKARRFENGLKVKFWGVVVSHIHFVSDAFPKAIFLAEYRDDFTSYAGKTVIYAGREIRHIHDGNQQAQGLEWALPDIFAPFKSEYYSGAEFGSLWGSWLIEMEGAVAKLREQYGVLDADEQRVTDQVLTKDNGGF
jgi:hypothetical protein